VPALSGSQKAYQFAISAACRSGATRSDYYVPYARITIGGTVRSPMIDNSSFRISDSLNAQPNTCRFECVGFTPIRGQEVIVTLGTSSNRIFAGHILTVTPKTANSAQRVRWSVDCVDYTWLLEARRISGRRYTAATPATILADLMTFAPTGFTSTAIETGLDNIADFTTNHAETLMQAIVRLMKMASKGAVKGGYAYVDYLKNLHAFVTPESTNNPSAWRSTGTRFWDLSYSVDLSQVRTRTFVLGGTTQTTSSTPNTSGAVPVADTRKFNAAGGYALTYGNQLRYTATSPASGPGWLTGVTSFAYSIPQGESVRVLAIGVNSTAARSISFFLGTGDGLLDHVIEDERFSDAGAQNRADADVTLFGVPEETVTGTTRDKFAVSGKTLPVSLTIPTTVSVALVVQSVEISDIGIGRTPRFPIRRLTAGTLYKDVFEILSGADQANTEGAI
jgi:hypothetical protein